MAALAARNVTSRAGAAAAAAKLAALDAASPAVFASARCTRKEGRSGQPGSRLGVSAPPSHAMAQGGWVQGDTGHSIVSEFASARALTRTLGAFGKNEVGRLPPPWPPLPWVPPLPPVAPARAHDPCQKAQTPPHVRRVDVHDTYGMPAPASPAPLRLEHCPGCCGL